MTTDKATEPKDPAALRAEIAQIRAGLGDTVEALAAKTDVKAQAQVKVDQAKQQVREKVEVGRVKAQELSRYSPWPQVAAGAAAAVVALVIGGRQLRARRATPAQRAAKTLRKVGRR